MTKARVIETNSGIQNEATTKIFDVFARGMRDKGWNGVDGMIASGIQGGDVLEVGPGPGYVGLELAKSESPLPDRLRDQPAMIRLARKNAAEYGLTPNMSRPTQWRCPFRTRALTP